MKCLSGEQQPDRRASKELDRKIREWSLSFNKAIKLLLLGTGESGKTTIIKQMKILHITGFSDSERLDKASEIRQNVHESIYDIVRHMPHLTPPIEVDDEQSEESVAYILALGEEGPQHFTDEYFDHVQTLWSDHGVQECFQRSNEFQLIDSAKYFLDRLDRIRLPGFNPTNQDILYSRKRTTAIQRIEFSMKVPKTYGGGTQEFWMFDVGGQRGERCKWIQVFEGIHAILFLAAASDFDQTLREDNTTNRLTESIKIFEDVWRSRFLLDAGFIIFLNKQDLLKEKIQSGKQVNKYFPDYQHYQLDKKEGNPFDEYTRAKCFIRDLFVNVTRKKRKDSEEIFQLPGLSIPVKQQQRSCFYHFTVATDTNNIKTVFQDVHTIIIENNLGSILN